MMKFNGIVCDYVRKESDERFSEIAHTAFDSRQDFDYDDFTVPTETEARSQFQNAQELIAEVEQKRVKFINEDLTLPKTS